MATCGFLSRSRGWLRCSQAVVDGAQALVKVRACPRCACKLHYRKAEELKELRRRVRSIVAETRKRARSGGPGSGDDSDSDRARRPRIAPGQEVQQHERRREPVKYSGAVLELWTHTGGRGCPLASGNGSRSSTKEARPDAINCPVGDLSPAAALRRGGIIARDCVRPCRRCRLGRHPDGGEQRQNLRWSAQRAAEPRDAAT